MNSRNLPSTWNIHASSPLKEFGELSSSIYFSLKNIEANYADFFNSNSFTGIKEYINMFNETFEKIVDICREDPIEDRYNDAWYSLKRYDLRICRKPDLYDYKTNGDVIFNKKYYDLLYPEVQKIFEIEEHCAFIIKKLWKESLTPIEKYEPNGKFKLLIKVLSDWRGDINTPSKRHYMRSRIGSSCSFITNNKIEKFDEGNSDYGYVYDVKDGFLAAYKEDAYMEEFISGVCPVLTGACKDMSDVYCVYSNGNNKVYTEKPAPKITTPEELSNKFDLGYNEVIVDLQKTKPCAVFYFSYGHKFICKDYDKAVNAAERSDLPIVEIPYLNNAFYQIDSKKQSNISTKDKLKRALSYKNNFASKNLNSSIINLIFKSEKDYKGSIGDELLNIAASIIEKNPATMEETNHIIADYYLNNAAKSCFGNYKTFIQHAIKKSTVKQDIAEIEM